MNRRRNKILDQINIHGAYKAVFSTPEGEEVLRHICKVGFIGRATRVKGDPEQSLENEGMRRLALSILRFAKKDHKEIVELIEKEYQDE